METKSVKVDNWGVFFLQKLQNFFNRTDHCDLTLQFNDNSQLKVHRLVLSACTDYFNMLHQTCEVLEDGSGQDILVMPDDLQADVIVPIVNFMYTGTLEFQNNMFERLFKTARDMNMTVLLKLLEAHRQATRAQELKKRMPVVLNKQAPRTVIVPAASKGPTPPKIVRPNAAAAAAAAGKPPVKTPFNYRQTTISPVVYRPTTTATALPEPIQIVSKYAAATSAKTRGPTRFDPDDSEGLESLEGQFDSISYESKPLLTAAQIKREDESSTFEALRKDITLKRPAPSTLQAPAAKKPNLEDVKELTENIKLRKQLAAQQDDAEDDPDDFEDDDTHFNDDEDDDPAPLPPPTAINKAPMRSYGSAVAVTKKEPVSPQSSTASQQVPIKHITIKEDGSGVNHAKIISEVLKKYPHLVKNNKNIKLKIMQRTSPTSTPKSTPPTAKVYPTKAATLPTKAKPSPPPPPIKVAANEPPVKASAQKPATLTTRPPANQPRRIDAKTMHVLIAKGAENRDGPWLCLKCGRDGRPIMIPSYKGFYNHLERTHKERIDPRLCDHCGWRSEKNIDLAYHRLVEHQVAPPKDIRFPKCNHCDHTAMSLAALETHMRTEHIAVVKEEPLDQQCLYCNKLFSRPPQLYLHMVSQHKNRAIQDGVLDFNEDELKDDYVPNNPNVDQSSSPNRIKVLSNISLPTKGLQIVLDPSAQTVSQIGGKTTSGPTSSSEAEALSKVASGIAASLNLSDADIIVSEGYATELSGGNYIEETMAAVHGEEPPKLVGMDGAELQLTPAQREEILQQLQGQGAGDGSVVMVLNEGAFEAAAAATDPNNVMVVYSQASTITTTEQLHEFPATTTDESSMEASQMAPVTTIKSEPEKSDDVTPPAVAEVKEEKTPSSEEENKQQQQEEAKRELISTLQDEWSEVEDEAGESTKAKVVEKEKKKPTIDEKALCDTVDDKKIEETTRDSIEESVDNLLSELERDEHAMLTESGSSIGPQTTDTEENTPERPVKATNGDGAEVKADKKSPQAETKADDSADEDDETDADLDQSKEELEDEDGAKTAAVSEAEKEIHQLMDDWDDDL